MINRYRAVLLQMGVDISGIQNNNQDSTFVTTLNVVGSRITCRKDVELTEK